MDTKIIYSMVGVGKTYPPSKQVLRDISLSYFYGAKIGVIGLNGAGKSTLLRIMAGVETAFNGETILTSGYIIGYLEQEPVLDDAKTVRAIVEEGVQEVVEALREFEDINAQFATDLSEDAMGALLARQASVQDKLDALNAWDLDSRLELAMDTLRCPPGDTPIAVLSGGERRRVALCRLLLKAPDILLLDEPTNHLDAESVAWLEKHLQQYAGTIIAVTHDRYFLDNVAGWILELDRGYPQVTSGIAVFWLPVRGGSPMTSMTLKALLEVLLGMQGTFVLCNAHGSLEFKGQDLYLSSYQEWLTVYHATPKNPESQSHLHLKWHTFQRAVVTHEAGKTPYLAFYGAAEAGDEAPLIWYFPSFYNWANGKTEIPENIAQYEMFVTDYGTTLQLVAPSATA